MTKIKNYELDSTINDDDKVIGTDGLPGPNFGNTKNYSIGSLATYIENQLDSVGGSGTLNTIAMFTLDGAAIGNSVIDQNAAGTRIDINSTLAVNGNTGITGGLDLSGVATFENDISVGEGLRDASDSYGTANQILTSTGTQTSWQDFSVLASSLVASSSYANDTEAAAGGVDIGELYRNGNIVQIRLT